MAIRTALLTSRNINLDTDFSKYIESVTDAGIISGFTVTSSSVAAGIAWVPCTRTNGDTIYALVQNFSAVSISGDGHVVIKVSDSIVDNGGGNEDGTGIATIEVVANLPSKNYLELATVSSGTVTPVAPTIKKLNELNTEIESIFSQLADLDERVEALEEAGAIDHLEESGIVWELYSLSDTLFKQSAPTLSDSTVEVNVWDVDANTEIHIQAIGSGTASNQLKLKVKMAGSPTTSLVCEVRKGIQVTVTENVEAYRYGDSENIVASGSLAYTSISGDWAELTFTLNNNFGGTKWELLDVVLYQSTGSGATVNASNYYVIACDSTQYSEGFGYVSVNGTTRARSKLMPYLSSVWFVQYMLSKPDSNIINVNLDTPIQVTTISITSSRYDNKTWVSWTATKSGTYNLGGSIYAQMDYLTLYIYKNGKEAADEVGRQNCSKYQTTNINISFSCLEWDIISFWLEANNQNLGDSVTDAPLSLTVLGMAKVGSIKILPREIKSLGNLLTGTIYGIHTDNIYHGGIMMEKTTIASTGAITLGNAVGYIKVNFNGEIIKIPYYS